MISRGRDRSDLLVKILLFLYSLVMVLICKEFLKLFLPFVSLPRDFRFRELTLDLVSPSVDVLILISFIFVICFLGRLHKKIEIRINKFNLNSFNFIFSTFLLIIKTILMVFGSATSMLFSIFITIFLVILSVTFILSVFFLIVKSQFLLSINPLHLIKIFTFYILIIILSIELSASIYNILRPFSLPINLSSHSSDLSFSLYYLPTSITPMFYSLFFFSWLWIPVLKILSRKLNFKKLVKIGDVLSHSCLRLNPKCELILIAFLIFIAYLTGLWVYVDVPKDMVIGNDVPRYVYYAQNYGDDVKTILLGDRGGLFFFLWFLERITGKSIHEVVRVVPAALIALTALGTYLFIKRWAGDSAFALYAAALSIFSLNTTIGMDTGILANWLAMALWLLMFSLLADLNADHFHLRLLGASVISLAIIFTHRWTWDIMMLILVLYTLQAVLRKGIKNRGNKFLIYFIFLNIFIRAFHHFKFQYSDIMNEGAHGDVSEILSHLLSFKFLNYNEHISVLLNIKTYYSIFFFILLSLFGLVLYYFKNNDDFNKFMMIWIFLCSSGIILSPANLIIDGFPVFLAWRFIFLIPVYIPAAMGAYMMSSIFRERKRVERNTGLIYLSICIFLSAFILLIDFKWGFLALFFGLIIFICKANYVESHLELLILITFLLISVNYAFRCFNAIYPHYFIT